MVGTKRREPCGDSPAREAGGRLGAAGGHPRADGHGPLLAPLAAHAHRGSRRRPAPTQPGPEHLKPHARIEALGKDSK